MNSGTWDSRRTKRLRAMRIFFSYNLRHLFARRTTSLLTIMGVAMVVFIFVGVLMLAHGVEHTLGHTGSMENVMVLRKGAISEIGSGLYREQAAILRTFPEIARRSDHLLFAPEIVVLINLVKRGTDTDGNVTLRGGSADSFRVRPQVKMVRGRTWRPGTNEVVTGEEIARRFQNADVGDVLRFGGQNWNVVGTFEADGSGFESETWGDANRFMDAFGRTYYSSAVFRLRDPSQFTTLQSRIDQDPRLPISITRETTYYESRSGSLSNFIRTLGLILTGLFSAGASLGAMITMYGAVANRTTEIGTLRALGFSRTRIFSLFVLESVLIGITGSGLGIALASLLQFTSLSTINYATMSELAYGFVLTHSIALWGVLFGVIMATLGGLLPAVRAMRTNVSQALKFRGA